MSEPGFMGLVGLLGNSAFSVFLWRVMALWFKKMLEPRFVDLWEDGFLVEFQFSL